MASPTTLGSGRSALRLVALSTLALLSFGASASCGGSSSETPPPLEPVPANVLYDRASTTLPGELGGAEYPEKSEAPPAPSMSPPSAKQPAPKPE